VIRVEATERHHAALVAHAHDELLGGALLAAGETAVVVLIEVLEEALPHGSLAMAGCTAVGGRGRRHTRDESEGENDSLHALLTPGRRRC